MERSELSEKHYQYLLHLFDSDDTTAEHSFLQHARIEIESDWQDQHGINFYLIVDPEIYKLHQDRIWKIENAICSKFYQFTGYRVSHITSLPDLDKFQILDNRIVPIVTPWEDINRNQNKLLETLRTSSEPIEFQQVGLISRTIIEKLASAVFNSSKHKHNDPEADLTKGKYKNQLMAFIQTILSGEHHKKFRNLAEAAVDMVTKSADFSNSTTHKLNAEKYLAEVCAISTISTISIIRFIKELEK